MSTDSTQTSIAHAQGIAAQYSISLADALALVRHRDLIDSLKRIYEAIDEVAASADDIHRDLEKINAKTF